MCSSTFTLFSQTIFCSAKKRVSFPIRPVRKQCITGLRILQTSKHINHGFQINGIIAGMKIYYLHLIKGYCSASQLVTSKGLEGWWAGLSFQFAKLSPNNNFSFCKSSSWDIFEESLNFFFSPKFYQKASIFGKFELYKVSTGPIFPIKSYKSLYLKSSPIKPYNSYI